MANPDSRLPRQVFLAAAVACALGLAALALISGPPADPGASGSRPAAGPATGAAAGEGASSVDVAEVEARAPGPGEVAEVGDRRSALAAEGRAEADAAAPATPRVARLRVVAADGGDAPSGVEAERVWAGDERIESASELRPLEDGTLELRWAGAPSVDVALAAPGFDGATVVDVADDPEAVLEVELQRHARVTLIAEGFADGEEGLLAIFPSFDAEGRAWHREPWDLEERRSLEVPSGPLSVVLLVRGRPPSVQLGMDVAPGEENEVVLTAPAGEAFVGRVLDKSTRQPLAGVRVVARPDVHGLSGSVVKLSQEPVLSGEDGSFRFDGLPIGPLDILLEPPFGPPVVREVRVIEGDSGRVRDLAIGGAACVSGRVRFGEGVNPAGLSVLVVAPGEIGRLSPDLSAAAGAPASEEALEKRGAVAEVAADGSFRCETAPAGRRVAILAQAGPAIGFVEVEGPLRSGEERRGLQVDLEAPEPARFTVVDDLGEPVTELEARVRFSVGPAAVWSAAEVMSDGRGSYEVAAPATDVRRIRIEAAGHLPYETSWPEVGGATQLAPTFELVATAPVEVLLVDEQGFAVKGGRVDAWPDGAGPDQAREDRTLRSARAGRRGRVALDLDRSVADWCLRARAHGHTDSEVVRHRKGEGGVLRLVLERAQAPEPATVSGRLVRRGDGSPVPDLRFKGLRGGVALLVGTDFTLMGVRPGRVQIVATAKGYESVRIPVDQLQEGQSVEVGELVTQSTSRVRVRVVDEAGTKVRRAKVRLIRPRPKEARRAGAPRKHSFPGVGDVSGTFERSGVHRGGWILAVDFGHYAPHRREVRVVEPLEVFEVVLKRKRPR